MVTDSVQYKHFLELEKRYSTHTVQAYLTDLQQFADFLLHQYEMDDSLQVSTPQVRSWVVSLAQDGVSARSLQRKLSSLRSYFGFLQKRGHIKINPVRKLIAPKPGKKLPITIPRDSLKNLLDAEFFPCSPKGIRDKALIELLYSTGIRRAELIGLRLVDLDLIEAYLLVKGKGGKERKLPFGNRLKVALAEYLESRKELDQGVSQGRLFITDKGKPCYPKFVYNLVNRYLAYVTTVEKRSPHILRHSFATHLADAGAELNAIKELLGHASLAATQVYTHTSVERLKEVYRQAHPKS